MRGWGPCPAGFYEGMELALNDLENNFKRYIRLEEIERIPYEKTNDRSYRGKCFRFNRA